MDDNTEVSKINTCQNEFMLHNVRMGYGCHEDSV